MNLDHTSPGCGEYQTWHDNVLKAVAVIGSYVRVDWPRSQVAGLLIEDVETRTAFYPANKKFCVRTSQGAEAWFLAAAIDTVRFPDTVEEAMCFTVIITLRK